MERTIVGLDTESISPIASDSSASAREVRPHLDHGDVVSGARLTRKIPDRAGLFVGSRSEFAAALLRVLAPAGAFEELIARRLVAAAWRLNRCALTAESRTMGSAPSDANRRRRTARAERRLLRLLSILEKLQRFRLGRWGRAVPEGGPAPPATLAPDDLPPVPTHLDELGWARRFDFKDRDDEPPATTTVGPEPDDISALWRDGSRSTRAPRRTRRWSKAPG